MTALIRRLLQPIGNTLIVCGAAGVVIVGFNTQYTPTVILSMGLSFLSISGVGGIAVFASKWLHELEGQLRQLEVATRSTSTSGLSQ